LNPQQRKIFADGELGCFWFMERNACPGQGIEAADNNIKMTHLRFVIFLIEGYFVKFLTSF
jgi:hypothetical protein